MQMALNILDELHDLLPRVADQSTRAEAARPFSKAFYQLYLARSVDQSPDQIEGVDRFLTGSAQILEPALPYLDYHLCDRVEARLKAGAEEEDWPIICELRSTLEAFKELYRPHLPMEDLIPEDEDLDAAIKTKAGPQTKPGPAPSGVPQSHWWWGLH